MTTELQADAKAPAAVKTPGDAEACKAAISEETARHCAEQYGNNLKAVVLTGSLARDEATCTEEQGGWNFLSDAEFLLVFQQRTHLPLLQEVDLLRQSIEAALRQRRIRCQLLLSACHPDYLQKMAAHIFAFELKACGRVVWGEPEILALIPAFAASEIPLEDAWWLLCNRMIEHLGIVAELTEVPPTLPPGLRYHTVKLYLDMATSFLVFAGAYAPSYRRRAEHLKMLADRASEELRWPFPPPVFVERVRACTDWKLGGIPNSGGIEQVGSDQSWTFWEEAVTGMQQLWRWELTRLTGCPEQSSNQELLRAWRKRQPPHRRLRGWLYVLRKQGWHQSWRNWPLWARRAWQASPRYAIYSAASELFFRLPSLLRPKAHAPEAREAGGQGKELHAWLPAVRQTSPSSSGSQWQEVAAEIYWNYDRFVVDTRS